MKGRKLSAYLRGLVGDPRVKAVVLRADSPGGDVLPSDLVADAVRQLKAAGKPVIVSQGDVAASGGYWISMDGTRILTTPADHHRLHRGDRRLGVGRRLRRQAGHHQRGGQQGPPRRPDDHGATCRSWAASPAGP